MGVGGTHDRGFEQSVVAIDAHERFDNKDDEAQILLLRLAWGMEQYARIGREAPVVVLSAAVDAGERLFVQ